MKTRFLLALTSFLFTLAELAWSQTPTPGASPAATPLPANAIVTCASGIQLVFVPGPNPALTAVATDGETPPGLLVAAVHTVRFVDKKGQSVDPVSITRTDRLIPLGAASPNGLTLPQILVDRN
ncbi:MAG: hypothetical protein ACJ74Y_17030 [Bryobacteraceae bacterium]